jgi:hypothetical protein
MMPPGDISQARVIFRDRVEQFADQATAYAVWLALPCGTRAAFRGARRPAADLQLGPGRPALNIFQNNLFSGFVWPEGNPRL